MKQDYLPNVYCKAFEDNSGAYELARCPKIRPRTKHINQKYHHFRSYVGTRIHVYQVSTEDQVADLMTKALGFELFSKFVNLVFGWDIKDAIISNGYNWKVKENVRECKENAACSEYIAACNISLPARAESGTKRGRVGLHHAGCADGLHQAGCADGHPEREPGRS